MLFGWEGNTVRPRRRRARLGRLRRPRHAGDPARQARRRRSRSPSSRAPSKGEYCVRLGAEGYIDRTEFDHWGMPPHWDDDRRPEGVDGAGARASARRIWDIVGERRNPAIVFEHPGRGRRSRPASSSATAGGMVVICAGTTGYSRDRRPALPLGPPEAPAGLPRHQRRAGERLQRPRSRGQDRPVPGPRLRLRRSASRACRDGTGRAGVRQLGGTVGASED